MKKTESKGETETAETTSDKKLGRAVLVTTAHRGVFFGYLVGDAKKEQVTLDRPRNVVYWTAESRGFLGLASDGPKNGARIGKPGERSDLFDITGVWGCTAEAIAAFEKGPWA